MAKDDTDTVNAGLFSKVVKFVRNPGTNWSDLDRPETDRESAFSKQALKEMIERKRRNDFVRKREFDMLRKLRNREAAGLSGVGSGDMSNRPSFFQSSLPSKPEDKAVTIKKIDEIEAQMSMQWWKTKHGGASAHTPLSQPPTAEGTRQGATTAAVAQPAYIPSSSDDLQNAIARTVAKAQAAGQAAQMQARAPSAPIAPPLARPVIAAPAFVASPEVIQPAAKSAPASNAMKAPMMGHLTAAYEGGQGTGFSSSKLFALDVDEVQHDPELEEAAIRFANGDDDGAEAGLLDALSPKGSRHSHEETWFTLFDLYRATGQHDKFESAAIDFASKFQRSAPQWFSIPEMFNQMANAGSSPSGTNHKADWRCPQLVGTQTVATLNIALQKAADPWCLDWSALKTIDAAAAAPLTRLFEQWAKQSVKLRFLGVENLLNTLKAAAPPGVSETNQDFWKLLLVLLRITHRPDEFELTALDFCVTYEVSPPSWENASCEYKSLTADGASGVRNTIIGEPVQDSISSSFGVSTIESQNGSAGVSTKLTAVELSGQIQGDPVAMLDKLETKLLGADIMVISCSKLIRVDFSAAGTLLNWVSARQGEGRLVQFSDVHRLVVAFFNVIGIGDHAKILTRKD